MASIAQWWQGRRSAGRIARLEAMVDELVTAGTTVNWPTAASAYRPNNFQLASSPTAGFPAMTSSSVYAVVSVIAEDIARLKVHHKRSSEKNGAVRIKGSPIGQLMRRPNGYQSSSDFWLNLLMNLLLDGNGIAYTPRNRNGEVVSAHPIAPHASRPMIDPNTGALFYEISTPEIHPIRQVVREPTFTVPARDVLHIRLFPFDSPLIGLSPLRAATYPVIHGMNIQQQQTDLFANDGLPNAVLSFKQKIAPKYAKELADAWRDRYRIGGKRGLAVVDGDASFLPMNVTARDAQLVEQYRLTVFDVARIYRVPPHMMGLSEQGGPSFNNAETLSRNYYNQCLGFWIEHIESALDRHFNLPEDEVVEFDFESSLMRTNFLDTVDALTKAVQGGVMTPDEARGRWRLPTQEGGDALYLQRQMRRIDEPDPELVVAPAPAPPDPSVEARLQAAGERIDQARRERDSERERAAGLALERMHLSAKLGSAESELATLRARLREAS